MNDTNRLFLQRNFALLIVSAISGIAIMIAMACVESLRRKTPINFIMLSLFTIAESYMVAAACSRYDPKDVSFNNITSVNKYLN